jgi:uncharacterized iron-regulated membrane protein
MNTWQRWLQAPQTAFFRRALFQVHLWLGIGIGLYVLLISLSGSALLLKSPLYTWLEPKKVVPLQTEPLTGDALTARMTEVYAGFELGFTIEGFEEDDATYIVLQKDGEFIPHYFNQYTGEDNGAARPWPIQGVEWLANIHYELMLGREVGRKVNGVGGALFVLMSLTGLIIWWQGRRRWWEGLIINPRSDRAMLWQVHSFCGFWALILMVAWGVSGFQLGFPQQTAAILEFLGNDNGNFRGGVMGFFRDLHFASPGGQNPFAQWGWILASFLPTLMFVSGVIVWWKRVVMKRFKP